MNNRGAGNFLPGIFFSSSTNREPGTHSPCMRTGASDSWYTYSIYFYTVVYYNLYTFFLVLLLGNRRTSHLDSLELYIMQSAAYLYQAKALVSFLVAVLDRLLNCAHVHANSASR